MGSDRLESAARPGDDATGSDSTSPPVFVKMDVSKYDDNIRLFRTALETYGRVDHAIACAGVLERGKWFDPGLTVDTIEKPETETTIAINLLGTVYFARIAAVYLRHGREEGQDKSLTLISSAAGFRDSPGLFMYQVTKHGVMGLLRTLRKILYEFALLSHTDNADADSLSC